MTTNNGEQPPYNGFTADEIADIGADVLTRKWSTPREFTLAEVEEFAPLLGMTPEEFITGVLS